MIVEQFPEKELIWYSDNVFIQKLPYKSDAYPEGIFKVYFNVAHQFFQIGMDQDEMESAEFTARMLVKALMRFRDGTVGCKSVQGTRADGEVRTGDQGYS